MNYTQLQVFLFSRRNLNRPLQIVNLETVIKMLCRFTVKNNPNNNTYTHEKNPTRIFKRFCSNSICFFSDMYKTQGFGPQSQIVPFPFCWICRFLRSAKLAVSTLLCCLGLSSTVRTLTGGTWSREGGWGHSFPSFCWLRQGLNKNPSVIGRKAMATWTTQMESLVQTAS